MAEDEKTTLAPHEHPEFDSMEKPWEHVHEVLHTHGFGDELGEPVTLYPNQLGLIRERGDENGYTAVFEARGRLRQVLHETILTDLPAGGQPSSGERYLDMTRLLRPFAPGVQLEVEITVKARELPLDSETEEDGFGLHTD